MRRDAKAPHALPIFTTAPRSLNEVVNFFNERFQMNLTDEQNEDLIAFLNSL